MCEGCRAGPSPKMDRRNFLKLGGAGLAGAVLLGTASGRVLAQPRSSLAEEFRSAAKEYGVPVELLLAMGYTNTFWEMPAPSATAFEPGDLHGHGTYGVMQLYENPSRDTVGRAASLTQSSEWEIKSDRAANVRGGAAVLADLAGTPKPDSLDGWQEAVAEYGGVDFYAIEVFQRLKNGASATTSTGESLRLAPQDVEIPTVTTSRAANTDYRKAEWHGAAGANYTNANRERSHYIDRLVVHVVQGTVSSAINTFQNPANQVSAHYIVGDEGRVVQCVRHEDIAYHAGNWGYNKHSIGIEHGGWADRRATWTDAKIRASAKLAAYCCRRHKIRVDRQHIIEHNRVPGTDHYCPGRFFPYDKYLSMVRRFK
jgi:N-acetylmuramoyl-L-alanine amidase